MENRISEVAVYFTRITDLPDREAIHWKRFVRSGDLPGWLSAQNQETLSKRVYYGNEFCEERIPRRSELEASCRAVREAGLPLTFLTPPVSDEGCDILSDRLSRLQNGSPRAEVVVNDWGVLRLLHEAFPSLVPVLGRLLNKFLRDPRTTARYGGDKAPAALRRSSLSISAYRRLLARYGVKRSELDNLYQGIDLDFRALGMEASLYVPFGYVTTGRICMLGNLHLPPEKKFATPCGPCPQPCLRVEVDLTEREAGANGDAQTFTQRGNTIFYQQTEALLTRGLAWARQQGARVVYQPEIPF